MITVCSLFIHISTTSTCVLLHVYFLVFWTSDLSPCLMLCSFSLPILNSNIPCLITFLLLALITLMLFHLLQWSLGCRYANGLLPPYLLEFADGLNFTCNTWFTKHETTLVSHDASSPVKVLMVSPSGIVQTSYQKQNCRNEISGGQLPYTMDYIHVRQKDTLLMLLARCIWH